MSNFFNKISLFDTTSVSPRKINNLLTKINKVSQKKDVSQMTFDFKYPDNFGTQITMVDPDDGRKQMICYICALKSKDIYEVFQIPKELSDLYFDILKYSTSSLISI